MLSGDCNVCINGKMPSYSATCVECGLSRKNYKPISHADRIRAMTDEELANFVSLCCGWTCAECPVGKECNGDECFSTWLGWLKQEAQCTSE
jgi:hypothetical protein